MIITEAIASTASLVFGIAITAVMGPQVLAASTPEPGAWIGFGIGVFTAASGWIWSARQNRSSDFSVLNKAALEMHDRARQEAAHERDDAARCWRILAEHIRECPTDHDKILAELLGFADPDTIKLAYRALEEGEDGSQA